MPTGYISALIMVKVSQYLQQCAGSHNLSKQHPLLKDTRVTCLGFQNDKEMVQTDMPARDCLFNSERSSLELLTPI